MKWEAGIKTKAGTERTIKRFAIFPITIGNETRWLETVYVDQFFNIWTGWTNEKFVTKELWKQMEG